MAKKLMDDLDYATVYRAGATMSLFAATPPPFELESENQSWFLSSEDEAAYETVQGRFKECLKVEHNPALPSTSSTKTITLDSCLGGIDRDQITQVWTARSTDPEDGLLVAKFYDPLYYSIDADGFNPFFLATRGVSNEVEAYFIPRFDGLFLTPISNQQGRNVYVLLMQFVDGIPADRLDIREVCSKHRNVIVEGFWRIGNHTRARGVIHQDEEPRNAIIPYISGDCNPGHADCSEVSCALRLKMSLQNPVVTYIDFELVAFITKERKALDPNLLAKMLNDKIKWNRYREILADMYWRDVPWTSSTPQKELP